MRSQKERNARCDLCKRDMCVYTRCLSFCGSLQKRPGNSPQRLRAEALDLDPDLEVNAPAACFRTARASYLACRSALTFASSCFFSCVALSAMPSDRRACWRAWSSRNDLTRFDTRAVRLSPESISGTVGGATAGVCRASPETTDAATVPSLSASSSNTSSPSKSSNVHCPNLPS